MTLDDRPHDPEGNEGYCRCGYFVGHRRGAFARHLAVARAGSRFVTAPNRRRNAMTSIVKRPLSRAEEVEIIARVLSAHPDASAQPTEAAERIVDALSQSGYVPGPRKIETGPVRSSRPWWRLR